MKSGDDSYRALRAVRLALPNGNAPKPLLPLLDDSILVKPKTEIVPPEVMAALREESEAPSGRDVDRLLRGAGVEPVSGWEDLVK